MSSVTRVPSRQTKGLQILETSSPSAESKSTTADIETISSKGATVSATSVHRINVSDSDCEESAIVDYSPIESDRVDHQFFQRVDVKPRSSSFNSLLSTTVKDEESMLKMERKMERKETLVLCAQCSRGLMLEMEFNHHVSWPESKYTFGPEKLVTALLDERKGNTTKAECKRKSLAAEVPKDSSTGYIDETNGPWSLNQRTGWVTDTELLGLKSLSS